MADRCTDLDRAGKGPGSYTGVCLHPDGVDGVGGKVADGRQLVVVHKLGLPPGQRQLGVGGVVHLVPRDEPVLLLGLVPLDDHGGGGEGPHLHVAGGRPGTYRAIRVNRDIANTINI